MTSIEFVDSSENVSYSYDGGTNGIGHLTTMSDPEGTTTYKYNAHGLVTREERVMSGVTYTTVYDYDDNHDLVSMTYPSGLVVSWERDDAGRIISTKVNGQAVSSQVSYLPFWDGLFR